MDLNARLDVNFARVDVNFQTSLWPHSVTMFFFFYFILISVNTKSTKFQPNIPSHFGEMHLNARVDVNFLGST